MKKTVILKTPSNDYLYSHKNQQLVLIQPDLANLIRNKEKNVGNRKYQFLKKHGFLTDYNDELLFNGYFSNNLIKSQIANTLQVTFETTDSCNLDCEYCAYGKFYSNFNERKGSKLDIGIAKNLLNYLQIQWNSKYNTSFNKPIDFGFYGGEPLLNYDFIEKIVLHVKELSLKHNTYTFSMTTNGILLKKHIDFLVKNDFRILISLDGNEQNNSFRRLMGGQNSFSQVLKNALYIKENYPEYFKKRVNFNTVLHSRNNIKEVFGFFKANFNKIPTISEINVNGIQTTDEKVHAEFWETYKSKYHSFKNIHDISLKNELLAANPDTLNLALMIDNYSGYCFKNYNDFIFEKTNFIPTGTCLPFSRKIFLTVNGDILPCERIGQEFVLGKVTDTTVEIDTDFIAKRYNKLLNRMKKKCTSCYMAKNCMECIFNLKDYFNCENYFGIKEFENFISFYVSKVEENPKLYSKSINEIFHE